MGESANGAGQPRHDHRRFTAGGILDGLFNGGGVLVHGQSGGRQRQRRRPRRVVLDGSGGWCWPARSVGRGGDAGG
ncbi:MAG: hypothetical protein IPG75_14870 [Gemmatimonadetes bacterium]|nr:hypothetical protein [Gemmatimonadota bacterium]